MYHNFYENAISYLPLLLKTSKQVIQNKQNKQTNKLTHQQTNKTKQNKQDKTSPED